MAQTEYEKAHAAYREAAKAAAAGDAKAKSAKADIMNDIRKIERDSARAGTVLSAYYRGEKLQVREERTESKQSLQEEYVRKFKPKDGSPPPKVMIDGKETTLVEHHRKRLLGK
jgi:hypothetical protein